MSVSEWRAQFRICSIFFVLDLAPAAPDTTFLSKLVLTGGRCLLTLPLSRIEHGVQSVVPCDGEEGVL